MCTRVHVYKTLSYALKFYSRVIARRARRANQTSSKKDVDGNGTASIGLDRSRSRFDRFHDLDRERSCDQAPVMKSAALRKRGFARLAAGERRGRTRLI
jgi:hypothetical protein